MVNLWARRIEKKYQISEEVGKAELEKCPECYYEDVVTKLVEDGIITEAPVA